MTQAYKQPYKPLILSDTRMLRSMCSPDNLPILESLLEEEMAQQDRLRKLKKKTVHENLSESKLEEALAETKGDVERFLGVDSLNIQPCKLQCTNESLSSYMHTLKESLSRSAEYFLKTNITLLSTQALIDVFARTSQTGELPLLMYGITAAIASGMTLKHAMQLSKAPEYISLEKRIKLPKLPRTDAMPIIAHEYAHHLQGELIHPSKITQYDLKAMLEGMSRGAERHISHRLREKEDNDLFLCGITKNTVQELKDTYANLCRRLNSTPNETLAKGAGRLSEHSIGNAYFCIEEAKNGKGVYRDALRSLMTE